MNTQAYKDLADIIAGIKKKYPGCGAAIHEVERELAVKFTEHDPQFSASLFLSIAGSVEEAQP